MKSCSAGKIKTKNIGEEKITICAKTGKSEHRAM